MGHFEIFVTTLSTILVACISLVGTVFTTRAGNNKIQAELDKHNAVQDVKLEALTEEVRKHNDFATRIPLIEQRVELLESKFRNK